LEEEKLGWASRVQKNEITNSLKIFIPTKLIHYWIFRETNLSAKNLKIREQLVDEIDSNGGGIKNMRLISLENYTMTIVKTRVMSIMKVYFLDGDQIIICNKDANYIPLALVKEDVLYAKTMATQIDMNTMVRVTTLVTWNQIEANEDRLENMLNKVTIIENENNGKT